MKCGFRCSLQVRQGLSSRTGSVLLTTLILLLAATIVAGALLSSSILTYKKTIRADMEAQAQAVADSELEFIYYRLSRYINIDLTPPNRVIEKFGVTAGDDYICDTDQDIPTTDRQPLLAAHRQDWIVRRSIRYETGISGRSADTGQAGTATYYSVRVEVVPSRANRAMIDWLKPIRVGRHMSATRTSGLQNAIYYEGDLELQPVTDYTVAGDITVNRGNVYIGGGYNSTDGQHARVNILAKLRLMKDKLVNRTAEGADVYRKPGTPGSNNLLPPTWALGIERQVDEFKRPIAFMGVDTEQILLTRPDLFQSANDVDRALIVPPPGHTDEYPANVADDPLVEPNRLYTKAQRMATTLPDGTVVSQTGITITVRDNPAYPAEDPSHALVTITQRDANNNLVDVTNLYPNLVQGHEDMWDSREGKLVRVSTIDVGNLTDNWSANTPDFNGIVYVNLYGNSSKPRAVRLKNAARTPVSQSPVRDAANQRIPNGFTVATNGGIYVQGHFNTNSPTLIPDDPTTDTTDAIDGKVNNPALLVADQVTLLSEDFTTSNVGRPLDQREARMTHAKTGLPVGMGEEHKIELHAGILTGNTPATATSPSGGAQNLVRFMEKWTFPDGEVKIVGSLGRLFRSRYFNAPYPIDASVSGPPPNRPVVYNDYLQNMRAGPQNISMSRGNRFVWYPQ